MEGERAETHAATWVMMSWSCSIWMYFDVFCTAKHHGSYLYSILCHSRIDFGGLRYSRRSAIVSANLSGYLATLSWRVNYSVDLPPDSSRLWGFPMHRFLLCAHWCPLLARVGLAMAPVLLNLGQQSAAFSGIEKLAILQLNKIKLVWIMLCFQPSLLSANFVNG